MFESRQGHYLKARNSQTMTKTGEAAKPPVDMEEHADNALAWLQANSRQVSIGALVVAVVVASTLLWRSAEAKKEGSAGRALAEAQRSFSAGNLPLAQSDLLKVVQQYGGTVSADQARVLLAQVYFDQKKVDEGLKVLDAVDGSGPFKATIHVVRAGGLEQAGKEAEAAAEFLKASDAAVSESDKSSYRADAARALGLAGKKDEALKIWQEMANDETNPLNAEAKLRVGELTATVAKG
ncbi:MAG: tetratricopeptide repeat protein [Gemmatimonadaceae bacterium]